MAGGTGRPNHQAGTKLLDQPQTTTSRFKLVLIVSTTPLIDKGCLIQGTVKLFFDFSEKDTFIVNKKRDFLFFSKFGPSKLQLDFFSSDIQL